MEVFTEKVKSDEWLPYSVCLNHILNFDAWIQAVAWSELFLIKEAQFHF